MHSKSISEFCKDHGISRTRLYEDWKIGAGPTYWLNGSRRRISEQAEVEWVKQREAAVQQANIGATRTTSRRDELTAS